MALGIIAATVATAVGALVAGTAIGSRRIEAIHPPTGDHVTIGTVGVHFVDTRPGTVDAGPPILFVHGASSTLEEARSALGDRLTGRRVVYVDRPGHGYSARGGRGMADPAAQARVLAGLLDQLGLDRVVVVGHSLGAAVAAAFGVLFPEKVVGHVFVAPATHPWPGGVTWYYELTRRPLIGRLFAWTLALPVGLMMMRTAAGGVFAPDPLPPTYVETARIPLALRPSSFIANAEDVAGLKAHVAAMAPRYPEIVAPTVIVTGDRDGVVWPSIHSEGLRRDIAGADLVVLPGVGHMPHHVHPEVIVAAIDRVVERARTPA